MYTRVYYVKINLLLYTAFTIYVLLHLQNDVTQDLSNLHK